MKDSATHQCSEAGQETGLVWDGPWVVIVGLKSISNSLSLCAVQHPTNVSCYQPQRNVHRPRISMSIGEFIPSLRGEWPLQPAPFWPHLHASPLLHASQIRFNFKSYAISFEAQALPPFFTPTLPWLRSIKGSHGDFAFNVSKPRRSFSDATFAHLFQTQLDVSSHKAQPIPSCWSPAPNIERNDRLVWALYPPWSAVPAFSISLAVSFQFRPHRRRS